MSTSWDEIRRLASDLQRAQLGAAAKKLSERNCIEVVQKLSELGLLNLIHTLDGNEYITRLHLQTEIRNEVMAAGGRLGLVELAAALNVDFRVLEEAAGIVAKADPDFSISVGQLLSREYTDGLCRDWGARLAAEGRVTLAEITKAADLPGDLVSRLVAGALGTLIKGVADREDPGLLYTADYVQSQKAVVQGAISALTKVTVVGRVAKEVGLPGQLFFRLLDELLAEGRLAGTLSGGRSVDRALWVPHIFHLMLNSYTHSHYANNGYVDLHSLRKMGVSETAEHLGQALPKGEANKLVSLSTVALGPGLWDDIRTKEVAAAGWADAAGHLPQIGSTTDADAAALAELIHKKHPDWRLNGDSLLYAASLGAKCEAALEPAVAAKAKKEGPSVLKELQAAKAGGGGAAHKDDDDDWDTGKGKKGKKGGKGGKGGGGGNKKATSAPAPTIEFMSAAQLQEHLEEHSIGGAGIPSSILAELSGELAPRLRRAYRAKIESVFLANESEALGAQKRTHADFKAQASLLYRNICLFDTGAELLDDGTAGQLRGFLLRSLCADAAALALAFVAGTAEPAKLTPGKATEATIAGLASPGARDAFKALYAALGKKEELADFLAAFEDVGGPELCGLNLRAPDKKLRVQLAKAQTEALSSSLSVCVEAAQGLLLSLLLLFSRLHPDAALHATGKFVPAIAKHVVPLLEDAELGTLLLETQTLVVKSLKEKGEHEEALHTSFASLKAAVLNPE